MINLMSPEAKRQINAAHTNSILVKYVIALPIIILVIMLEIAALYIVLMAGQNVDKQTMEENSQKAAEYSKVKSEAETFKSNLAVAKYILDTQAPYTAILSSISAEIPGGAGIQSITIDPNTFGSPTQMQLRVSSHEQAIEVKNKLQSAKVKDDALFDDIKLESTTYVDSDDQTYFLATYLATFSKGVLPS